MFIDVKQLFEVEGQVIPFTHDLDMSAIELWGTAPLTVRSIFPVSYITGLGLCLSRMKRRWIII